MSEDTTANSPTRDEVLEALENVIDPELGLDFVSLGLVYDVEVEGSDVHITFTLTSPGCPIGPQVTEQMQEFVSEVECVENVYQKMTFSPPWSPDRMSEDAKFALGF
jgi:metal-sulfur cluster biosynthetic enzyme